MIIKCSRIPSQLSKVKSTIYHVFEGKDNDNIEVLKGSDFDVEADYLTAKAANSKYALRHIKIASKEDMTDEQALELISMYCDEFGANKDSAVIVKHTKDRADNNASKHHYHVYLPEVMADNNYKVMDASFYKMRQEKLARLAEIKFNHAPVLGRHNKSIIKQLRKDELNKEADIINANTPILDSKSLPVSTYSESKFRIAKRSGESLNHIRQQMKDIKSRPDIDTFGKMLNAVNEAGYDVRKGDKENTYILVNKGSVDNKNYIGSASRFFGMQKNDFNKAYEEFITNKNDTLLSNLKDSFAVKSFDKQFKPEKKESVKQERQGTSQVGNTTRNTIKASTDIPTGHFSGNKESLKSADTATQAEKEYANFVNSENAKIVESSAISEETRKKLNAIFEENSKIIFQLFSKAFNCNISYFDKETKNKTTILKILDNYKENKLSNNDIEDIKNSNIYKKATEIGNKHKKASEITVNSETSINDKDTASADNTDDTPMYIFGMGRYENKEEMERRLNKKDDDIINNMLNRSRDTASDTASEDDIINKLLNRPRNTASDDKGNSGINPNHNDKNASKAVSAVTRKKSKGMTYGK